MYLHKKVRLIGEKTIKALVSPFPKRHISDSSKLKELADESFKFKENGRKLPERVENAVGKGEIARYEQFLLFPHCFQKTCAVDTSNFSFSLSVLKKLVLLTRKNQGLFGKGLKFLGYYLKRKIF